MHRFQSRLLRCLRKTQMWTSGIDNYACQFFLYIKLMMLMKHACGLAYSTGREIGHFHLLPEEVLVPLSQNFNWFSKLRRKILQAEDPPGRILLGFISILSVSVELQSAGAKWNSPWQSLLS